MRIEDLDTPALVVDLDILRQNLRRMADYCRQYGLRLRPHTKTHKIPEVARWQMEAGAVGITVAKVGEAEVMASAGLDDILIAYPVVGDAKLERLMALAAEKRMTVALDSPEALDGTANAAERAGMCVGLLVECDLGMGRCGVQTPEEVIRLAQLAESRPGVHFEGILFYPGHIRTSPERQLPLLQSMNEKLQSLLDALAKAGLACGVVSGGSTPAAFNSHLLPGMNEIRPGTYVFNDRNTMELGACDLADCALRVLVTVVSTAVPGKAMVDGGSKTFSSDRLLNGTKEGFGWVVEEPGIQFASMTEEHGHLDVSQSERRLRVGDRLSIIPNHVCTCVNLHERIYFHRQGDILDELEIAGRGKLR
jgi:D-serine deaminase-like pyridoxal phosphate-dependent protein